MTHAKEYLKIVSKNNKDSEISCIKRKKGILIGQVIIQLKCFFFLSTPEFESIIPYGVSMSLNFVTS